MSTTEDTSAIDEKKAEDSGVTPDFKGFMTNYLTSIVFTIGIGIFVIGGLGLYTTKVAQSNILPDDINLAPYTVIDRVVKEMPVDINIMKPSFFADSKDCMSQKVIFNSKEYLDSFNKSFLCSIKNSADPNAGLFANAPLYFSNVYDNIVAKNFFAINTIFFYLSYLPESIIMLLYGIFGIFLWMGLYFFNVCISIFYHFLNIPQLFRTTSDKNDKHWETTENVSFLRFMKLVLFFFIWIPLGLMSTFVMPIFFTIYGLISPLFATYDSKQGSKQSKTYGMFDFIKDTFAYKQFFFFILATLSLFSNGIKYLGSNSIIGILIAVIFAYFMGLYKNEMPESGINGFTNKIKQNIKHASIDLSNTSLVEICQRIPIDDEKMDKIIQKGSFRQLTKPKSSGGDIEEYSNETANLNTQTVKSVDQLKNDFNEIETDLQDSKSSLDPEEIDEFENEINQIKNKMIGGKKVNKQILKPNKKYNIRWT
jgi:hypothetical protein